MTPNLLAGAALTCNIKINKDLVLKNMSQTYGNDAFVHDLNGVGFHHVQSQKIKNCCTKERISKIADVVPQFEAGRFSKPF